MQETAETEGAQIEVFLNSVPILQKLSPEERSRLAGALEEHTFTKDQRVVQQVLLRWSPESTCVMFCSCSITQSLSNNHAGHVLHSNSTSRTSRHACSTLSTVDHCQQSSL